MIYKNLLSNKASHGLLDTDHGFTLIEMVTSIAILGLLTSLSLFGTTGNNGIVSWTRRANIDSTKALLNATAADCLQKSRFSSDTTVDDSIISNQVLESKGYEIDTENTSCTSFGVKPINDTDALLFPMSFAIVSGKLTKSGQPTGPDSIPYCKSWAGILCTEGEELKKLVDHMAAIDASKDACDAALAQKKADKMTGGPVNKWNPNATKDCPTRPPVDTTSNTCTINGCLNNPVWLVEGAEYATSEDAEVAERAITKAGCLDALSAKTDPTQGGNPTLTEANVRPTDCDKDYYFAKGKRFGDETSWKTEMCSINIKHKQDTNHTDYSAPSTIDHCAKDKLFYFCGGKDLGGDDDMKAYKACLIKDESSKCGVWNDDKRKTSGDGKYTNPTKGMPPCGEDFWVCKEVIVSEEKYKKDCKECIVEIPSICEAFGGDWCKCK